MFPSCSHHDDPPTDTSIISSNTLPPSLARMRYGFQICLSLLVILFSMGCVIFDLAWNGTMTAISNVAWPSITFVLGLHFNSKKDSESKSEPTGPPRRKIVADPRVREDVDL